MGSLRDFVTRTLQCRPKLFAFVVLTGTGLVAYGNSLSNSFHFDDIVGVVRNPALRDLKNIPAYFTDPSTFGLGRTREWRPILQITYALNYAMAGLNPASFRIFNLLFHVGTAYLIFLIVTEICEKFAERSRSDGRVPMVLPGLLAGALFAVHPANSEAVDYIWARSSLLATFFYLLAFYCYLRGPFNNQTARKPFWHAGGVLCFALGMGTKATAVTLPAILFLYEFLFLNPASSNPFNLYITEPRRLRKYLPAVAVSLAYLAVRMVMLPRMFTSLIAAPTPKLSSYSYLITQFRAWIYYIRIFAWPHPLIADYSGFGWSHSLWDNRALFSLGLALVILILAWHARKTQPLISFFSFWYFIALLPEASFIPLEDAVVGYRAYPAYVSLAVIVVMLSHKVWPRIQRIIEGANETISLRFMRMGGALAGIAFVSLTAVTIARNQDWRDEITLWSDILNKDPANPRAYMFLGMEFLSQGDYASSQDLLDKAIQMGPKISHARILKGYLNFRLDRNEQALLDYTEALELDPRSPYAFFYRGELYRKLGKSDEALTDYHAALRFMPYYTDAYLGVAMAYLDKDDIYGATAACRKLVEVDPQDRRGYDCLGTLLVEQTRLVDAINLYKEGIARNRGDSDLWRGLGGAYEKYGMDKEARDAYDIANKLQLRANSETPQKVPLLE